jgi:O-antigen ligase
MKEILNGAILIVLIIGLWLGTLAFGAVTIDYAVVLYATAALLAVLWMLKIVLSEQASWVRSPMYWPVLAFVVYATVRYATAPVEFEARQEVLQVWLCALAFMVTACNLYRARDRRAVLVALLVLAIAETGYGFWQFFARQDSVLHLGRPEMFRGRASGTFVYPNNLAGLLSIVMSLVIADLILRKPVRGYLERNTIERAVGFYSVTMIGCGLFMTQSYGAWLALAVGLGMFMMWRWRGSFLGSSRVVIGFVVSSVLAAVIIVGVAHFRPVNAAISGAIPTGALWQSDPMIADRPGIWEATAGMILNHPLLGVGSAGWQSYYAAYRGADAVVDPVSPYSDLLLLLAQYGVIGFGITVAVFAAFFWHSARLARILNPSEQRGFSVGVALSVAVALVLSLIDLNLTMPANAMILASLMGLAVAMDNGQRDEYRLPMSSQTKFAVLAGLLVALGVGCWLAIPTFRANHYMEMADDARDALELDHALVYYDKAAQIDRGRWSAHASIGEIFLVQSTYRSGAEEQQERAQLCQKAVSAYKRALRLNSRHVDSWLGLAAANEGLGLVVEAREAYRAALRVDPHNQLAGERAEALEKSPEPGR